MASTADPYLDAFVTHNGDRLPAVAAAFLTLFENSWPEVGAEKILLRAKATTPPLEIAHLLQIAFDDAFALFPTVAFWWKDEQSTFLGACRRLGPAAGVSSTTALLGLSDVSPEVAWNRQGNLYRRDDRAVLDAFQPKLNIVERQDRSDKTIWLRTSKVPYRGAGGAGTVGGFDMISEAIAIKLRSS